MSDLNDMLHSSMECPACRGKKQVVRAEWLQHAKYQELQRGIAHSKASPIPQDRERVAALEQEATRVRNSYNADDDGNPVIREVDGGPFVPCPQTAPCARCTGRGKVPRELSAAELRVVCVKLLQRIESLQAEVDKLRSR